jgi:hypothetical protein
MIDIARLIWDDGNVAHIARHNVTPQEVEEACHDKPIKRAGYKKRIIFIGVT